MQQARSAVTQEWATGGPDMEEYYRQAESDAWLAAFWDEGSPFRSELERLGSLKDKSVCEIACGRGRHSVRVAPRCQRFCAIDISTENVVLTQARLRGVSNAMVILTDGSTLPIMENSTDAVFCWDAMVHFEESLMVRYVGEIARILKSSGRALLHHSNLPWDRHSGRWTENPACRSPLSVARLDAVALANNLVLDKRTVIDWAGEQSLDALTVYQKY